jgi:hypothetical protein
MNWGEVYKNPNMVSLYHFNETSGTALDDEMGNYDCTIGTSIEINKTVSKAGKSMLWTPPSNNNPQGTIYTIVSDAQLDYQDIENTRTIGCWCYPLKVDDINSSYAQSIVDSEEVTTKPFWIYKLGIWNGSNIENTFKFGHSLEIFRADSTHETISFLSNQDYYFSKPYFILIIFKPSDVGTNNGYVRFYINWVLVNEQTDPNGTSQRWTSLYTNSGDRYLYIGAKNTNPSARYVFQGYIDEVFISKQLWTPDIKNKQFQNWYGSLIN